MKEEILNTIRAVHATLTNTIYPLKDELEFSNRLNYYWDVIDFIKWVQVNHPDKYEVYYLETECGDMVNFGWLYVHAIHPKAIKHYQEFGISNIALSTEDMITELWNHVVSLESEDKLELMYKMLINMEGAMLTQNKATEPVTSKVEEKLDTVLEHLNPTKSAYKTKQEEREAKAKAEITKYLLKK